MMEEAKSDKAPTTRSRRKMAVDLIEGNKSPAVNTPTKKRGGKRGVKPDLDLIDENTPDITRTLRTPIVVLSKDIVEPQEKALTPSRRSTRIKSNTSIVSETAIDSPRSKRAARRASLAGSDGEAQVTPIRQTRRTRKDSTSSIEKEHQIPTKQGVQITEVIIEEPEMNPKNPIPQMDTTIDQNNSSSNTRRSPRLLNKNKNSTPTKTESDDHEDIAKHSEETSSSKNYEDDITSSSSIVTKVTDNPVSETLTVCKQEGSTISQKSEFSISSANLIKEIGSEHKKIANCLNKSVSDAECKENERKRHRTKSWSTMTTSQNSKFGRDSETNKDTIKSHLRFPFRISVKSESEDGFSNPSVILDKSISQRKKKDNNNFIAEKSSESLDKINVENIIANESGNKVLSPHEKNMKESELLTSELLSKKPSGDIKTVIYIEDSDSNSGKVNLQSRHESEDQCVPVVDNPIVVIPRINLYPTILGKSDHNILNNLDTTKAAVNIDSCEPMDVDETMPDNTILCEATCKDLSSSVTKFVSTCDLTETNLPSKQVANNSERKSCNGKNIDKFENETTTTIILSQLKDSTADNNVSSTTPQITKKLLSKSVDDLNLTHENEIKKNLSLHCSTSTPLQGKIVKNFKGIHTDFDSNANSSKKKFSDSKSDKILDHLSKFENSESSEEENELKKSINRDQEKKISLKETINNSIQNSIETNLEKEDKIEAEKESLNKRSTNENDEAADLFKKQQESNSGDKLSPKNKKMMSEMTSSSEAEEIVSDDSQEKNNFVDREADDAGTDYESGDSRDESELQYEKENEIIDRGETLTTEEEFSDDSDYEKDSFIVSSNEDDELLDGTDDDLSMSDNELKMNAKSKKKYNDRKLKEQKKASREMFESRHKLKTSDISSYSEIGINKKNKRRRLSSSESQEDLPVKPRKTNRRRFDSTKEATLIEDENEQKISMKNNTYLSSSIRDVNDANEKEITINNKSVEENDPISHQIKKDPKTPEKNLNSTITFIDSENIIQIDKNASTEKAQTQLSDPLERTVTSEDCDDSLSSDNEKIQSYDAILKDLNNTKKIETNTANTSLNIVKKSKKRDKTSIVEELNLTQVKSAKKDKSKLNKVNNSQQIILSKNDLNESSSDSIDLNLLFSEESNSSEDIQNKKNITTKSDDILPIKETEETNIKESEGKEKENDVHFFIDTEGSFGETSNKSQRISLIENNSVSMELSDDSDSNEDLPQTLSSTTKELCEDQVENESEETENSDDDAPLEVSYQSEKGPKRKSKERDTCVPEKETVSFLANTSILKTPASEKNMKRHSDTHNEEHNDITNYQYADTSLPKKSGGEKKNRRSESHSEEINDASNEAATNKLVIMTPASEKKKKRHSESHSGDITDNQGAPIETITNDDKKRKKTSSKSVTLDDGNPNVPEESVDHYEQSSKKRKRRSPADTSREEIPNEDVYVAENVDESLVGNKKKKRKISTQTEIVPVLEPVRKEESRHEDRQNYAKKVEFELNELENTNGTDELNKKRSKKRKEREDDDANTTSKIRKQITFGKVPRLPSSVIMKLVKEPEKNLVEEPKAISTTQFLIEKMEKNKIKPSNYLEESIYVNKDDENKDEGKKHRKQRDKPKVLPFVPTASTSSGGSTTTFKVKVIPTEITFVAQTNTVNNFRENYMYGKKIKRLGTYEMYKRQRRTKMSKF